MISFYWNDKEILSCLWSVKSKKWGVKGKIGYLKRGIYLKTNADRGGYIKNIFVRNIQLDQVEDCLYITANYHGEGKGYQSDISNVYFES